MKDTARNRLHAPRMEKALGMNSELNGVPGAFTDRLWLKDQQSEQLPIPYLPHTA